MKEEKPGELVEELRNIVRELRLLREVLSPGSVDDIDELGEDEEGVEEDMVPQFPGLVGNDKAPGIKKKAFIVVDSDLDGIFSAAAIGLENDLSGENAKVVFSNPLYIHNFAREAQRSIYDRVFVADIGINNRNPEQIGRAHV